MKIPKYMSRFKCIGGSCEDNCCIGWDVDIDKVTYQKYQKVTHKGMKRELDRYIRKNPDSYDDSVDYAFAKLDSCKRCSFLNADHLCMIHKHLGESYLSNVCATFPRIYNRIDDQLELSATLSCPEVARHVLSDPSSMSFVDVSDAKHIPIITYDVNQKDARFRGKLPSKLLLVRDRCLSFFDENCADLSMVNAKLAELGEYIAYVLSLEKEGRLMEIETQKYAGLTRSVSNGPSSEKFERLADLLIKHLHAVGSGDSPRYIVLSQKASKGDYALGKVRFNAFLNEHPYLMSHYFKNHIFKNLFPFSEGSNVEEATLLLFSRYIIVNRELSGLAAIGDHFGMSEVVAYLGAFSKVIEHHKHYEDQTLKTLKSYGYNLSRIVELLLNQP